MKSAILCKIYWAQLNRDSGSAYQQKCKIYKILRIRELSGRYFVSLEFSGRSGIARELTIIPESSRKIRKGWQVCICHEINTWPLAALFIAFSAKKLVSLTTFMQKFNFCCRFWRMRAGRCKFIGGRFSSIFLLMFFIFEMLLKP